MGKRGRKPKPLALHRLEGTAPRMRVYEDQITIGTELPPAKPLAVEDDPIQSAEWDRIIEAVPPEFYNALDSTALAVYVQARARLFEADRELVENGSVISVDKMSKSGEIYTVLERNPSFDIWKQAAETVLKCADRLGLAPGARSRLAIRSPNEAPKSKFGDLLGRKQLPAR